MMMPYVNNINGDDNVDDYCEYILLFKLILSANSGYNHFFISRRRVSNLNSKF